MIEQKRKSANSFQDLNDFVSDARNDALSFFYKRAMNDSIKKRKKRNMKDLSNQQHDFLWNGQEDPYMTDFTSSGLLKGF